MVNRRSLLASILLLAVGSSAAATPSLLPGIGASDRRLVVDMRQAPWNSLVRVQTELGERCTGFLVAPQVVITAAHCLFLPRVRRFIQPRSVHVLLAYRAGAYRAHAQVTHFTVPPGYQPLDETATAGADRAVLLLDTRIAPDADTLAVEPVPASLPVPILLGGYGQDREEVAVADLGCRLLDRATDGQGRTLLLHDCDATRGTSGAPLLWRRPDGRWAAIGIQIEAAAGAGGRAVPLATPADSSAGR